MPRDVYVDAGRARYVETISVGAHVLQADELGDAGGNDVGPGPYELLLGALGACASITVRMYAERGKWPLEECAFACHTRRPTPRISVACETEVRMIDRIDMEVTLIGPLSEDQRLRLMEIANHCQRSHRTLTSQVQIRCAAGSVRLAAALTRRGRRPVWS